MKEHMCPYPLDLAGKDIHQEEEFLRDNGPIMRVDLAGVEVWAINSAALLKNLLSDSRVSKDAGLHWPKFINGEVATSWPFYQWVASVNAFNSYGDDHRRLRKVVASGFSPRRISQMRPRIVELTSELLDELGAMPRESPVDLRANLAYPLPFLVICELFGVPERHRGGLGVVMRNIFNSAIGAEEAAWTQSALQRILTDLVAVKRAIPGEDMTSDLVAACDVGSTLSESELMDQILMMLGGGFETTVNLIDNAITALLVNPGQLELVRNGSATWGDVIDETLRWHAPLPNVPLRYAVEDIALDGEVTIHRGEAILAQFGAACRDPEVHGDTAGSFDIMRLTRSNHMAFGYGVHYCMGASLAKLEAEIALSCLFEVFPEISLAVEPGQMKPIGSILANGHKELPVYIGR